MTARDLEAEGADARDRRHSDPFHLRCDVEANARWQMNAAHDRYQDELREHGLPTATLAAALDPQPVFMAAMRLLQEAEGLVPNPQDEVDGLGDWIREGILERIEHERRLRNWRSAALAFDALEGFARGAYGPALAAEAQALLDGANPWILIAYARSLRGLDTLVSW